MNEDDPAAMFASAEEEIKEERYQVALDELRTVKNKFPYSKYSAMAQLRMADVYFLQESYAEAASAYETFRDLHPKHDQVPYAIFRIGKSYYNDTPSNPARDLTPAQKAIEALEDLLKKFPSSAQAKESRDYIRELKSKLAQKEIYVGKFYVRENEYVAAKKRFESVLALFPDTPEVKEASVLLEEVRREHEKNKKSD